MFGFEGFLKGIHKQNSKTSLKMFDLNTSVGNVMDFLTKALHAGYKL
jgi:hypothetical protein